MRRHVADDAAVRPAYLFVRDMEPAFHVSSRHPKGSTDSELLIWPESRLRHMSQASGTSDLPAGSQPRGARCHIADNVTYVDTRTRDMLPFDWLAHNTTNIRLFVRWPGGAAYFVLHSRELAPLRWSEVGEKLDIGYSAARAGCSNAAATEHHLPEWSH